MHTKYATARGCVHPAAICCDCTSSCCRSPKLRGIALKFPLYAASKTFCATTVLMGTPAETLLSCGQCNMLQSCLPLSFTQGTLPSLLNSAATAVFTKPNDVKSTSTCKSLGFKLSKPPWSYLRLFSGSLRIPDSTQACECYTVTQYGHILTWRASCMLTICCCDFLKVLSRISCFSPLILIRVVL